jgi:Ser/Thr protein kinase RdoA (MazF antagonist)
VVRESDLHLNNALNRGDDIVLFDKAARIWSCPAVFDLALIAAEGFPVRYGVDRPGDPARMAAFTAAYGDLPPGEAEFLDHFALIHTLIRYPSPFVPEQREILATALERLAR